MGNPVDSVAAFMNAVRAAVGERWPGPSQAPVSDQLLDALAAKGPLTEEHRAWLREYGGQAQEARIPAENGVAFNALSVKGVGAAYEQLKKLSVEHEWLPKLLPTMGLPFANAGRQYVLHDGEQWVRRATDNDFNEVVAPSISAFFDAWAEKVTSGEAIFSRDDENDDWSLWALSAIDARVKMRALDDLTTFANFAAFSKLAEAGAPVFNRLVKEGLIELTEPKAIPAAKSLFGLGLVTRAQGAAARAELAEIALLWLEDDSVVDELFADAAAVVHALLPP